MQRFVRVRPAPGKPKVSHPGQGLLAPDTSSAPRFIGYRHLDINEAKAEAAKLGVLPRQVDLYVPTGEDEVHPLRLVEKAIKRNELLVTGATVASTIGHAKKQIEAAEAKAEEPKPTPIRKSSKGSSKDAD